MDLTTRSQRGQGYCREWRMMRKRKLWRWWEGGGPEETDGKNKKCKI
jgi:hypothetical protein